MTPRVYAMIFTMAFCVILLRFAPFLLMGLCRRAKVPAVLVYLGRFTTGGAIAMLVVYSLYGVLNAPLCGTDRLLPALAASLLTVLLQALFRNPLLSIIAGTAVFMFLI